MARYQYVVMTNPVEGREAEYNDWYTNTHLREVTAVPGFKSAVRYKVVPRAKAAFIPKQRYLALYEIETDNPEEVLAELSRRSGAGQMAMSTALDRSNTTAVLYELVSEYKPR